jgi:Zn-dependent protease with chaperone function
MKFPGAPASSQPAPPRSMPRTVFHALALLACLHLLPPVRVEAQTSDAAAPSQERSGSAESMGDDELKPVAVPEPSQEAMRYYHSGNWLWILNQVWALFLPGVLVFSGASARLRNLAQRIGRGWFLTIGLYVIMYLAIVFALDLPLAYYEGFVRQHAYGLSNQSLEKWLKDSFIRLAIEMAVGFAFAWIPYVLLARSPRRWWLYLAILWVPFLFVTVLVVPIWISPLFNEFGAMKNKALERSILELAERAGIEGGRVFEVDKSVDTKALNAYVTGVLNTKRIVLWDTSIAAFSTAELKAVMAHEMGHYVLGHVIRSIFLSSVIMLAGLFLVDRLGRQLIARYAGLLGFDRLSDVASVPLLIMLMEVAFLVLSPAALAYSRYQEHEADRFALDLTHANNSAAKAFVKLQTENLGNPRPGFFYKLFRSSHPSIGERIDFCNTYRPWRSAAPHARTGTAPVQPE